MKLRRWFPLQQLLFVFCASLVFIRVAGAQDIIVTRDGKTQQTKILGVSGANVQIQVAAGQVTIPLATIASVKMAAPPDFAVGVAAFEAKDFPKALANIKGIADKFKGLPVDWAQQSVRMLGDIYVAIGKISEAETAYKDFQKLYPGTGSVQADVGLARIAAAKKDFAGAQQKLAPILAQALKERSPAADMAPAYSQAFLVSGQVKEAGGDFSGALEDYLRTVTLFPADRLAVSVAQERADALRKAHAVAVP